MKVNETNSMDMFQNSSIIYHTESILEMQILCLLSIIYINKFWNEYRHYGKLSNEPGSLFGLTIAEISYKFMWILLGEHIMAYCFDIYRKYELKHHGKANRFGIEQAPIETCLRITEFVIDLIIFIMVIIHFNSMTKEQFLDLPFLNFWILVDLIIMAFAQPYTYMSQLMMITGEIINNVYTLFQVQKVKLIERRKFMNANP